MLILTCTGKDAALAQAVLKAAKIGSEVCHSAADLCARLEEGAGSLLVTQESLNPAELRRLVEQLKAQPPWSDIPIAFLTAPGDAYYTSQRWLEILSPTGNLTLLERPVQKMTLLSTIQVALRSRRRQYQVRDLLKRLRESQLELQEKIADLERFEEAVVGRELRMMALEKELEQLKKLLHESPPQAAKQARSTTASDAVSVKPHSDLSRESSGASFRAVARHPSL